MTTSSSTGTDSFVQTPPDGGGKTVATTIVTRDDGVTQVHRQEAILSDPVSSDAKASVLGMGAEPMDVSYGVVVRPVGEDTKVMLDLLSRILDELIQIKHILAG